MNNINTIIPNNIPQPYLGYLEQRNNKIAKIMADILELNYLEKNNLIDNSYAVLAKPYSSSYLWQ